MDIYQELDKVQLAQMKIVEKELEKLNKRINQYLTMLSELSSNLDTNILMTNQNRRELIRLNAKIEGVINGK
jgi:hypothetical protein